MLKRLLVLSLAVVALSAAPASAGTYPPPGNNVVADDTTVVAGQDLTLTARTFMAGTSVTFTMFSAPIVLGSSAANASGVASLTASVPNVATGTHVIEASGTGVDGMPLTVSTEVAVSAPAAPPASGGTGGTDLPRTGSSSTLPMARIAVSLLAVGALMVFGARWRQQHATIGA